MTTSTALPSTAAAPANLPKVRLDWMPLVLVPLLMLAALPMVGSTSTWLTLTVAGLAMGMIVFVVSSGLTLVFGLMDVLNFGHGAFIALGAYVAASVLLPMQAWVEADSLLLNLGVFALAIAAAVVAAGAVGLFFERVVVRPVYGQHLKQILITMGGMIVAEQLIKAIWGPETIALQVPATFRGAVLLGDAAIEKFRLIAVVLGLVFARQLRDWNAESGAEAHVAMAARR